MARLAAVGFDVKAFLDGDETERGVYLAALPIAEEMRNKRDFELLAATAKALWGG